MLLSNQEVVMNPVNDFYFRNSQPYQPQLQFNFPQALPPINSRFVTNIEEARASQIDGISYNLYLDSGTGKIYLKKVNNNGTADFLVYAIEEQKAPPDPLAEINTRLTRIEEYIGGMNEPVSGNTGTRQSEQVYEPAVTVQNERNDEAKPAGLPEDARNDKWKKRN